MRYPTVGFLRVWICDEERAVPEGVAPSPESSIPKLAIGATRTLFDALGAPLVAGTTWSPAEDEGAPGNSAIVNRALAERLWPGESPLGKRLRLGLDPAATPLEIVGVAPDLTYEEIQEQSTRSCFQLFVPLARYEWRMLAALVRGAGASDPAALAAPAAPRGRRARAGRGAVRRRDLPGAPAADLPGPHADRAARRDLRRRRPPARGGRCLRPPRARGGAAAPRARRAHVQKWPGVILNPREMLKERGNDIDEE